MTALTRRELLRCLSAAAAVGFVGSPRKDWFGEELVCIHIYGPKDPLPAPLVEKPRRFPPRRSPGDYFQIGLPELAVCTTRVPLLSLFQYFWPFTREERDQLRGSVKMHFTRETFSGAADLEELARALREQKETLTRGGAGLAVLFTYNDFTRHWTADLIAAGRDAAVDELVFFKDPSRAPYLCDFPARQKGFKKPPP